MGRLQNNLWGINADGEGVPDGMCITVWYGPYKLTTPAPSGDSRRNIGNTGCTTRQTAAQVILAYMRWSFSFSV
jgi:hypothetical protein